MGSESLVFSVDEIEKLRQRIEELTNEKQKQKSEKKEIRQLQAQLSGHRKAKEKITNELQMKCNEMMMLKFGTIIDLDQIEGHEMNGTGAELKLQLRALEAEASRQYKQWEDNLFQA